MGAYGVGYFDNDDAGEVMDELAENPEWVVVEKALNAVFVEGPNHLEAPAHGAAIGAAAVVAHLANALAVSDFSEDIETMACLGAPPAQMIELARKALARIQEKSELGDLWDEAGLKADWSDTLQKLENALR